jgi:hypothetical protein
MTTLVPCFNLGFDHCDFCQAVVSTPVPYACTNFLHNGLPVFPGRMTGTWAVCRACSILINQEEWERLAERCYREFVTRHRNHEQPGVRAQMQKLCRSFAEHRITSYRESARQD